MNGTRVNIIGFDSRNARWFWNHEKQSWNLYAHLATSFESSIEAAKAMGAVSMWQRNQDPDDRMDAISIKEVS